jgi:hypothetical protein
MGDWLNNPAPKDGPWINTIDNGVPSSNVLGLPAQSENNFELEWIGQDDIGGSGIASYEIYVSENNQPYELWMTTTDTSAIFNGNPGSRYRFYSNARDGVGHKEVAPIIADAETTIISAISSPDINGDGNVDILDLSIVVAYWLHNDCIQRGDWCEGADIVRTGKVDFEDYSVMAASWSGASPYPTLYDLLGGTVPVISESRKDYGTPLEVTTDCVVTILKEGGGYNNENIIGIYDLNNPNEKLEIFIGSDSVLDTATIRFNSGAGTVENLDTGQTANIGTIFGFYLISPDQGTTVFYTDESMNVDNEEHGLLYNTSGYSGIITSDPDTVVAFEDLVGLGDQDYDDMVIGLTNMIPTTP